MHTNRKYRALVSVSDKQDLEVLAATLSKFSWQIYATTGTAQFLNQKGYAANNIDELVPISKPYLGGRVKTLNIEVLAGLLWDRKNPQHNLDAEELCLPHFDLLLENFYDFAKHSKNTNDFDHVVEYIDVGGPTMLRSAAKNNRSVIPLVDKADYKLVSDLLDQAGGDPSGVCNDMRLHLARKAFDHIHQYDSGILDFLSNNDPITQSEKSGT